MIKVWKSISLLMLVIVILSNIAFAQSNANQDVNNNNVDDNIKVSTASHSDMNQKEMQMEEHNENMGRKDVFSYENEGFGHQYDAGPSYEGYSKDGMIFGMVFEHIGSDIDPREIKQHCNDTGAIADIIIAKLKEKVGDLQKLCSSIEEHEKKCSDYTNTTCSRIGTPIARENATEMEKMQWAAYSCPPNKDAIVEACRKRISIYMEQNLKNSDESCRKRLDSGGERMIQECENFRQQSICDKDKFMEKCMGSHSKENKEEFSRAVKQEHSSMFQYAKWKCYDESYESQTDTSCKSSENWNGVARKYCEEKCNADKSKCGLNSISVSGSCEAPSSKTPCPEVTKPACNSDEEVKAYYNDAGCVTSYQCIKREGACPEPAQKPVCADGQSMTAKYDDKRCVTGYECITYCSPQAVPTCKDGETLQKKVDNRGCGYYYCQIISATDSNSSNSTLTAGVIGITGNLVSDNHDDASKRCENAWAYQQRMCLNIPSACDKDTLIRKCTEMGKNNIQNASSKIKNNCEMQAAVEIKHAEQRCSRIDEERQHCNEQSAKRCAQMSGLSQRCRDFVTEENLRKFIIEEAGKRCRFTGIIQDEEHIKKAQKVEIILAVSNTATKDDLDKLGLFAENLHEELKLQDTTVYKGTIEPKNFGDVKLLPFVVNAKISTATSSEVSKEVKTNIVAGAKAGDVAGKLVSLRDSDVPSQYLYIIEDKANDVLNVSSSLEDIGKKDGQKGIGYKIKLFLGLAKAAEQKEVAQLSESKGKLNASIEALTKLIDEVPSDVAKAVLKEQVENLKKQQDDLKVLIESKEKKSKGLLGLFG